MKRFILLLLAVTLLSSDWPLDSIPPMESYVPFPAMILPPMEVMNIGIVNHSDSEQELKQLRYQLEIAWSTVVEHGELSKKLKEFQLQFVRSEKKQFKLQARIESLENQLKEKDIEIANGNNELTTINHEQANEIEKLRKEIRICHKRMSVEEDKEKEIQILKEKIEEMELAFTRKQEKMKGLKSSKDHNERLKGIIAQKGQEIGVLKGVIAEKVRENNRLKESLREKEDLKALIQTKEKETKILKEGIEAFKMLILQMGQSPVGIE